MGIDRLKESDKKFSDVYEWECFTLTGKSKLEYKIGKHIEYKKLYLRISKNIGKGSFPPEWISARIIEAAFENGAGLNGKLLNEFLDFKDRNSGGFLMATLKDLGAVSKKGSRYYFKTDLESALAEKLKGEKMNES